MSQKLRNMNITLTNSIFELKKKEKVKSELNNENNYYSLLNKKRKRNLLNKKMKIIINKCPSCASALLRKHYNHIHDKNMNNNINIIGNKNKNINEMFYNDKENSNLSKNIPENKDLIENKFPLFIGNSNLLLNKEDMSSQKTFAKTHNILKIDKENELSETKENKNDLFHENKINGKIYNKNNDIINNNNNKINSFDIKDEKNNMKISSIYNTKENKNNERLNKDINFQRKKIIHYQISEGNNKEDKKELREKLNEPLLNNKSYAIFLKVQKCVAPEI